MSVIPQATADQGNPSRTDVRSSHCPACDAEPGDRCIGARGQIREANHRERIQAYQADIADLTW